MLRWIFILLMLVNIVVAALFFQEIRALFMSDEVAPVVVEGMEQKQPSRQTEINSQEVTSVTTAQQVCVEVRGFADQQAMASTKQWLKNKGLFARERTRVIVTEQFYRVYVGKFNTRAKAQKGLSLLRQQSKGFKGSVIFQYAPADWRISLNVFPAQDQAKKYLASIKKNVGGIECRY